MAQLKVHKSGSNGYPICGTEKFQQTTKTNSKVTCQRCLNMIPASKKTVTQSVTQQSAPVQPLINRIALLIDASGSMQGLRYDAINVLNAQIDSIKNEATKLNQQTFISIGKFESGFSWIHRNVDSRSISPITQNDYWTNGQTALIDAVDIAIDELDSQNQNQDFGKDVSFLLITITDGQENASRRSSVNNIAGKIRNKQGTDHWSFVFSVPRGGSYFITTFFGVPIGNIKEWDQTSQGIQNLSVSTVVGTAGYFQQRSIGKTATKSFFTTDLSNISNRTLQANLDIMNDQFKKLQVPKECSIKDFVESEGLNFVKGNGFYELTKPEKVQDYKEILIMNKQDGKIYGGDQARRVLNMPTTTVCQVKPGNHMNFRIFIKSTSLNRILVRGTMLLYKIK
jgi:hypothetical protein